MPDESRQQHLPSESSESAETPQPREEDRDTILGEVCEITIWLGAFFNPKGSVVLRGDRVRERADHRGLDIYLGERQVLRLASHSWFAWSVGELTISERHLPED